MRARTTEMPGSTAAASVKWSRRGLVISATAMPWVMLNFASSPVRGSTLPVTVAALEFTAASTRRTSPTPNPCSARSASTASIAGWVSEPLGYAL